VPPKKDVEESSKRSPTYLCTANVKFPYFPITVKLFEEYLEILIFS
jgi:hypothetical protein